MSLLSKFFRVGRMPSNDSFKSPPPPTDEDVERAEHAPRFTFPPCFLAFMRESRDLRLQLGARFYWVGGDNLGERNIIAANRVEHSDAGSPLPDFLITFYNDGMGNQVCFDTRQRGDDGEHPVVFWAHELPAEENLELSSRPSRSRENAGQVSKTFTEWLKAEQAAAN